MAREFYVAPGGRDTDPGTKTRPLASIAAARDAVRQWRPTAPNRSVIVWLAGGLYPLRETLVLGLEDAAPEGGTITYSALPGQVPVLSGGVAVHAWERIDPVPVGLPASTHGRIWSAPVPAGVESFHVMFDRTGMLPRARTVALKHPRQAPGDCGVDELHRTLPMPAGATPAMFQPPGAEIVVVGHYPWTMCNLPVQAVDTTAQVVRLGAAATYPLTPPCFGWPAESIWIENTFAGLDAPGKWVLDSAARRIYLWPRDGEPGDDIVAPRLIELIRVEGRLDPAGPEDIPARGLVLRGLTFTHGERFSSEGLTGLGLQHDWERYDAPTALVRLRGAEECAIEDCRFEHSGGAAIRLDLHCQRNRIAGNEISEIGGIGILLAGYGPGTKDVNRDNEVSRNHIHHIGRLWWHALGIWAWQSGRNRIADNHIHHVPYTAIAVTGRINWDPGGGAECARTVRWQEVGSVAGGSPWGERERFLHSRGNIIEGNEIHAVIETMHDGNGIYVSGGGGGNIVRGNFIHDVPPVHVGEAIRCDDDQHDTLIEGNIVWRFGGLWTGTGICSKGRNHIVNNIIACPQGSVDRGMISLEDGSHAGSRIERNILYAIRSDQPFQFLECLRRGQPPDMQVVLADGNIYFNAINPHGADEYLAFARQHGREQHSLTCDPLFENVARGDFRLKAGSPAFALGFVPIRVDPPAVAAPDA